MAKRPSGFMPVNPSDAPDKPPFIRDGEPCVYGVSGRHANGVRFGKVLFHSFIAKNSVEAEALVREVLARGANVVLGKEAAERMGLNIRLHFKYNGFSVVVCSG